MQMNYSDYELDVVRVRQDQALHEVVGFRLASRLTGEGRALGRGLRIRERVDRALLRLSQGALARQLARQQQMERDL